MLLFRLESFPKGLVLLRGLPNEKTALQNYYCRQVECSMECRFDSNGNAVITLTVCVVFYFNTALLFFKFLFLILRFESIFIIVLNKHSWLNKIRSPRNQNSNLIIFLVGNTQKWFIMANFKGTQPLIIWLSYPE